MKYLVILLMLFAIPVYGQYSANMISNGNFDDVADQTYEWNDFTWNFFQLASYAGRTNVGGMESLTAATYGYPRQTMGHLSFARAIDTLGYTDEFTAGNTYKYGFYSYWPSTNAAAGEGIRIRTLTDNVYIGAIQKNVDSWGWYEIESVHHATLTSDFYAMWTWPAYASGTDSVMFDSIVVRQKLDFIYADYELGNNAYWGTVEHPIKTFTEADLRGWHKQNGLLKKDLDGVWQKVDTTSGIIDKPGTITFNREDTTTLYSTAGTWAKDQSGYFSYWVRFDSLADANLDCYFWAGDTAGGNYNIRFYLNTDGILYWEFKENSADYQRFTLDSFAPVIGETYHIVISSSGSVYYGWVNGVAKTVTITAGIGASGVGMWTEDSRLDDYADNIVFGSGVYIQNLVWPFEGAISQFMYVQTTTATQSLVSSLYNGGTPNTALHLAQSPYRYYKFNENDGNIIYDYGTADDDLTFGYSSDKGNQSEPAWTYPLTVYNKRRSNMLRRLSRR
jgi:hypothetical protein